MNCRQGRIDEMAIDDDGQRFKMGKGRNRPPARATEHALGIGANGGRWVAESDEVMGMNGPSPQAGSTLLCHTDMPRLSLRIQCSKAT
jgi:hypothetical protein